MAPAVIQSTSFNANIAIADFYVAFRLMPVRGERASGSIKTSMTQGNPVDNASVKVACNQPVGIRGGASATALKNLKD